MLKNRNPFQWPRLIPNFFSDQRDVETLTKGARAVSQHFICVQKNFKFFFLHMFFVYLLVQCVKLASTKSFNKLQTRFNAKPFLGCEGLKFDSDEYWECCIRRHAGSLQHQVKSKSFEKFWKKHLNSNLLIEFLGWYV